jgi:hypothetical protein
LAVLFGYLLSSHLFGVAPFDPVALTGSAIAKKGALQAR